MAGEANKIGQTVLSHEIVQLSFVNLTKLSTQLISTWSTDNEHLDLAVRIGQKLGRLQEYVLPFPHIEKADYPYCDRRHAQAPLVAESLSQTLNGFQFLCVDSVADQPRSFGSV